MAILKKHVLKQAIKTEQEKSEILLIPNMYKDTFKDLVDSSNVKHLAIPLQINLPSNDISDSKDDPSNPEMDNDLLDRSQGQRQRRIILSPILGLKSGDEKVKGGKKKRNNGEHQKGRKEAIGREGGISEVSIY